MVTKKASEGKSEGFDFTRPDKNLSDEDRRARDAQLADGVGSQVSLPTTSRKRAAKKKASKKKK